jgi:UDP-N-acetyl-2-amino-2-deoxyglucuronate dehydrogenase
MSTPASGPTFALIGAAGYVARRHMAAIRDIGGVLVACHDIADSAGTPDGYFPEAPFFAYGREFRNFLTRNVPDYFVVCTPNDLHEAHASIGVRLGSDVIVEKTPTLSSRGIDALSALEVRSGHAVHPVLQMRHHNGLRRFKDVMARRDSARPAAVTVRYVTHRELWSEASWQGDARRGGSILFNAGIPLFDGLTWALGPVSEVVRAIADPAGSFADGTLRFGAVTVDWTLSTHAGLPPDAGTARRIWIDGQPVCDFSDQSGLHTVMYREIIAGRGHRIGDVRDAVRLVERICDVAWQGSPAFPYSVSPAGPGASPTRPRPARWAARYAQR